MQMDSTTPTPENSKPVWDVGYSVCVLGGISVDKSFQYGKQYPINAPCSSAGLSLESMDLTHGTTPPLSAPTTGAREMKPHKKLPVTEMM